MKGVPASDLACHAALPAVIDSTFLHLLRINFFAEPDDFIPYESEAQLLLSPLFTEIAGDLYEMKPDVRTGLLRELVLRFGDERLQKVATLLDHYTRANAEWRANPELAYAQHMTALAVSNPALARRRLDEVESSAGGGRLARQWYVAMRRHLDEQQAVREGATEQRKREGSQPATTVDQELVAHLFVPLDQPDSPDALNRVRALWDNCRDQLGMTRRIAETRLPARLPLDFTGGTDGPVAAVEDDTKQFQMIARVEHDLLNVSFVAAAPVATAPGSRSIVGDWAEFSRLWAAVGGEKPLLGSAVVLLARSENAAGVDVRAQVPRRAGDAHQWWDNRFDLGGLAGWETTPGFMGADRRLVLVGRLDQEAELSRFAWSDGGTELPPLARYLMHAAKLRYMARVRDRDEELDELLAVVGARGEEVVTVLDRTDEPARAAELAIEFVALHARLAHAAAKIRTMTRSVEIARSNMTRALETPLAADTRLAEWLSGQLADDAEYLDAALEQVTRLRPLLPTPEPQREQTAPKPTGAPLIPDPEPAVAHRVFFSVVVVNYSARTTPQQQEVQRRLYATTERVVADMGVDLRDTDRQDAGDGMMVVLPAGVSADVALPRLLRGWRAHTVADNAEHPENRIRLRLSVGAGAFTTTAIGFTGATVIEVSRLLDSTALRRAAADRPEADVVAVVSDRIFHDVVLEGYPGLREEEFEPVEMAVKSYRSRAWLWTGGVGAGPEPASRDIWVIHGRSEQARSAVFDFLRALGLRPIEWDLLGRIGNRSPLADAGAALGLTAVQGVLVIITPGDVADGSRSVLHEAGRALALYPDRTVITEIGDVLRIRDLGGRSAVGLYDDSGEARIEFQRRVVQQLAQVGYPVSLADACLLDERRFAGLV